MKISLLGFQSIGEIMTGLQHPAWASGLQTGPAVGETAKELSRLGKLLRDEKLDRFNLFRWLIHIFF